MEWFRSVILNWIEKGIMIHVTLGTTTLFMAQECLWESRSWISVGSFQGKLTGAIKAGGAYYVARAGVYARYQAYHWRWCCSVGCISSSVRRRRFFNFNGAGKFARSICSTEDSWSNATLNAYSLKIDRAVSRPVAGATLTSSMIPYVRLMSCIRARPCSTFS